MNISIQSKSKTINGDVLLPGSKSESNRVLLIKSLCNKHFEIHNLSSAQDTLTLNALLAGIDGELNVGPAGTAMRFLTARLAILEGNTSVLTGSDRMLKRPIGTLVAALNELGAEINYLGDKGFPPLKITGKKLLKSAVELDGSISSQFITALALIAPALPKGLTISFKNELISKPYLMMTLDIMSHFGVKHSWSNGQLIIPNQEYINTDFTVESDWSGASYWYEIMAFAKSGTIKLAYLKSKSLQGDSVLQKIFENFGVFTSFDGKNAILTKKSDFVLPSQLTFDCNDCPDIAQTLAVTAAGLGIAVRLEGLKSLRIKETDRIAALIKELAKVGIEAYAIGNDVLVVESGKIQGSKAAIETYEDHRMAMCFAPLVMLTENLEIEDYEVVNKSYPTFWNDLKQLNVCSFTQ